MFNYTWYEIIYFYITIWVAEILISSTFRFSYFDHHVIRTFHDLFNFNLEYFPLA